VQDESSAGKYDQLAARAMNRLGDILEKPEKKVLKVRMY
jgi:hypothetical protein